VCINAKGKNTPNFYIFKGKKRIRNYLRKSDKQEFALAMQPKVVSAKLPTLGKFGKHNLAFSFGWLISAMGA